MQDRLKIQALREYITHPDLRCGLEYWCRLRRDGHLLPRRADLDPMDIPHLLPTISLVDVLTDPPDFRFRLIGGHSARSHTALTGQSAFEVPVHEGREVILARYRRCTEIRRPVHDIYDCTTQNREVHRIEVITCPLSDDDLTVNMLLNFGLRESTKRSTGRRRQHHP